MDVFGADLRSLATFRIVLALLVLSDLASRATFGRFLQIAFVYWFTTALKSGPEWRVDHTALYYALSLDQLATPLSDYLLNFPTLLQMLTFGTFPLEAVGPILLFCPFFTGPVRTGTALDFMSLHSGIWLTLNIGIFPWISAFCMVCFFPTWFWDRATALRSALLGRSGLARRLQDAAERSGRAVVAFCQMLLSFAADVRQLLFASPAPAGGPLADNTGRRPWRSVRGMARPRPRPERDGRKVSLKSRSRRICGPRSPRTC